MAKQVTEETMSEDRFKDLVFSQLKYHTTFRIPQDQSTGVEVVYVRLVAQVNIDSLEKSIRLAGVVTETREELESVVEEIFSEMPNVAKDKGCDFSGRFYQYHYFKILLTLESLFSGHQRDPRSPLVG